MNQNLLSSKLSALAVSRDSLPSGAIYHSSTLLSSTSPTMLSRIAVRSVRTVQRVSVAQRALSTSVAQCSGRQQQQQQQQAPRSSMPLKWMGAVAAVLAGGVAVAACEKVVEQPTGGNVDYAAVRQAIEDALEKEVRRENNGRKRHRQVIVRKLKEVILSVLYCRC
jgi:hypothetical protein